jgi:hypothetical protein
VVGCFITHIRSNSYKREQRKSDNKYVTEKKQFSL